MSDPNDKALAEARLAETVGAPARLEGLETTHSSGERPAVSSGPASLEKGQPVDRYVVLERLGTGGMGEVYSAWDPVLDRKVALKLMKAEHHESAIGDELRLRLMREAQALAKVTHPNVVAVHDVGLIDGQIYLAMEFVEGETLTQWLSAQPRDWRSILEVFLDAGEGLVGAHEAGVTHRDFKPDNVIVSRQGRARVMDFGLAHAHDSAQAAPASTAPGSIQRKITSPGVMLGTPAYMSPEALYGKPTDPRSDEFSFAVALYEALYGQRPFEGTTAFAIAAEIERHRVRPAPRGSRVPRRIFALLVKALSPNPAQRFQTVRALLLQLGRRKSSRRRQVLTAIAVGLSVVALLSVGSVWRRELQRCSGLSSRFAGIWDDRARAQAKAAFGQTQTPWAAAAWAESQRLMDAWSAQWMQTRTLVCKASVGQADEQLGQTILCLSRKLADFEATAKLLRTADAEIAERAPSLVSALPNLAICEAPGGAAPDRDAELIGGGLAEARALIESGKLSSAADRLRALEAQAEAAQAGKALAEARWLAARLAGAQLDFARADALAEEAILLAQQHRADEIATRAWVDRVGFAGAGTTPKDAERWVRFAQVAVERFGAPRDLVASLSNNEAVVASRLGRHADALALHQKALALREAVFGPRSALAARSWNNVGVTFRALGRTEEAVDAFRRALTIEEHVVAAEHPAVADTLNNLANALHALGRDDEALAVLTRSLELREKAFGPKSLKVAQSLSNLGAVMLDADRPAQARPLLERALAIREASQPPNPTSIAATLTNLATAQRRTDALDSAIASDTRALELLTAAGAPPALSARSLIGLATTSLLQGMKEKALAQLSRALAVAPPGSLERGDALFLVAKTRADGTAAKLLEEALSCWPAAYSSRAEAERLLAAARR